MRGPPLEWHGDHWQVREPDGPWAGFKRAAATLMFALFLVGIQVGYALLH